MTLDELTESLAGWRQGDYSLGVGGHLYAERVADPKTDPYDVRETINDVVGLVVVTQTCDIVNCRQDGETVTVCPLVKLPGISKEVKSLRRPRIASIQHPPDEDVHVDLSRMMAVSKELLASWNRVTGISSDDVRRRFAIALERLFGRFAFPDALNEALRPISDQAKKRHSKNSAAGQVYRSLYQLRLRAAPYWEAKEVEVTLFAVLFPDQTSMEATREAIATELENTIASVILPNPYRWSEPGYLLRTVEEFSMRDFVESQPMDFDYLSIAQQLTA